MERTTQVASRVMVTVYGLDGKKREAYAAYSGTGHFADLCNTLDHCRNTGLEPIDETEAKAIHK